MMPNTNFAYKMRKMICLLYCYSQHSHISLIVKRKKMVLSYLISQYLVQPESIRKDFNVTEWNMANQDFYVPPHPILYLLYLKPKPFLFLCLVSSILPAAYGHLVHLVVLAATIVFQPISGTFSSSYLKKLAENSQRTLPNHRYSTPAKYLLLENFVLACLLHLKGC